MVYPSMALERTIAMLPIPIQELAKFTFGQNDFFDSFMKGIGIHSSRGTYSEYQIMAMIANDFNNDVQGMKGRERTEFLRQNPAKKKILSEWMKAESVIKSRRSAIISIENNEKIKDERKKELIASHEKEIKKTENEFVQYFRKFESNGR